MGRPWSLGFTPRTLPLTWGPPGPRALVPGTWSNTQLRCGSMELTAAQGSPAPEDALLLGLWPHAAPGRAANWSQTGAGGPTPYWALLVSIRCSAPRTALIGPGCYAYIFYI